MSEGEMPALWNQLILSLLTVLAFSIRSLNKELLIRTAPVNKELLTGTVPVNKGLLTGTVSVNTLFH